MSNLAFLDTVEFIQLCAALCVQGRQPTRPVLIIDLWVLPSSQVQIPTFIFVWVRC